jgi:hypothetical protein
MPAGRGKSLCSLTEIWCHATTVAGSRAICLGTMLHSPRGDGWCAEEK